MIGLAFRCRTYAVDDGKGNGKACGSTAPSGGRCRSCLEEISAAKIDLRAWTRMAPCALERVRRTPGEGSSMRSTLWSPPGCAPASST